jgi:hypothetical protein
MPVTDLERWLETHGLQQYAGTFAANDIDLGVLIELTDADDTLARGSEVRYRDESRKSGPATCRPRFLVRYRILPDAPQTVLRVRSGKSLPRYFAGNGFCGTPAAV